MLATKPFLAPRCHGFVQCFMLTCKGRGRLGIHQGHFCSWLRWLEGQAIVNHKWAGWIHNPCHLENTSERGTKPEEAHKWAGWLHNPCRLGGPQRLRAGDKISDGPQMGRVATKPLPPGGPQRFRAGDKTRSGPQVGRVATYSVPPWGSPTPQSGGQNQQWPTSGHIGYMHAFSVKLVIFFLCGKVV